MSGILKKIFGKDKPASVVEQLQQLYTEILTQHSAISNVHVDEDDDVVFEVEDLGTLVLSLHENDPEFFALIFPNFLDERQAKEEFGADVDALFRAVDATRRRCKAANTFLRWNSRDSTWNASVSMEAFVAAADELPSKELIASILERNISAIHTAIHTLVQILRGDDDDDDDDNDDNDDDDTATHTTAQ